MSEKLMVPRGDGGEQRYLHLHILPTHTLALKGLPVDLFRAQMLHTSRAFKLHFVFLNIPLN